MICDLSPLCCQCCGYHELHGLCAGEFAIVGLFRDGLVVTVALQVSPIILMILFVVLHGLGSWSDSCSVL